MQRFIAKAVIGIMIGMLAVSICHAGEKNDNTIGVSLKKVLQGLNDDLTNNLEDTTLDGLPILVAATEYNEVMVELTGNPDDLLSISIDVMLSTSANEKTDTQRLLITQLLLENVFPESSKIWEGYHDNLQEGLQLKEAMERKEWTVTEENIEFRVVVIRVANGFLMNVEIQPESQSESE